MAIDKQYNKFLLICDICDEPLDEKFATWEEAVQAKKNNNWQSKRISAGYWHDICTECDKVEGE